MSTTKLQVKSKQRVQDFAEVFTNEREVKSMCDLIPNEIWNNIDSTFLEPTCGEGVFLIEILKRKFALCQKKSDYIRAINSVYGMEIQADNVQICINNIVKLCQQYFKPSKKDIQLIEEHIIQCDSLKVMKLLEKYNNEN